MDKIVPPRIANILLAALKGGVVPRVGLEHITVGRTHEIAAILQDLELVAQGGGSFRFIVGRYGAGKSFLLQTIRNYATAKGFAVMDCELSQERRLSGAKGHGLNTYKELVKNLATRSKPDGGALPLVLERWISTLSEDAKQNIEQEISDTLHSLQSFVGGVHFAQAVARYWEGHRSGEQHMKDAALAWLRGEYLTRKDAKDALGINFIVTDINWYDFLKLFAGFLVRAGFLGLVVMIDEMGCIMRIPNSQARQNNYEKLLTIYNDALGTSAPHMGFMLGGTPQCLEDRHRGVFSYEALRTRLADGHFSSETARDAMSSVIRLTMLTLEEMYVLIEKLRDMHANLHNYAAKLAHEDLVDFLTIEYNRVGANTHITPREIIRDFLELLALLWQNPECTVQDLLSSNSFTLAKGGLNEDVHADFADFTF